MASNTGSNSTRYSISALSVCPPRLDVRDVKAQLLIVVEHAIRGAIQRSGTAGDDDDAVALAPARGLHHEVRVPGKQLRQLPNLALDLDHGIELGHRHPGLRRQLLGEHLVIDQWITVAAVVGQRIERIALVDAHHAVRPQATGGVAPVHHFASTRKRRTSVRR
jgi:hypothetical protein